jgi:pimeloyl-ACP methyl ester carboxylesterase
MTGKMLFAACTAALGLFCPLSAEAGEEAAAANQTRPQLTSLSADDGAARCAGLVGKQIAGATIDKTDYFVAGSVLPPFKEKNSPEFCRVHARINPVEGSGIKMQVWLPSNWNSKVVGFGGGGFEGGLGGALITLRGPVGKGYAAVVTNAGHDSASEPRWALRQPEKVADFGHRANHLGAAFGKALSADYYRAAAQRAYFHGCSNGGRDALMLAQRYPDDYDAIIAGAPANDFTGLLSSFARIGRLTRTTPGPDTLSPKLKLVHEAAVAKCDRLDGLKDGLIERPTMCRFNPAVVQCKSGTGADCLSKAEVATVRAIYRGTYDSKGREIMPGLPIGSEYEWAAWLTSPKAGGPEMATNLMRYMVYSDPAWPEASFDLDRDFAAAKRQPGPVIDAVDPDLRPFFGRGGKLLMYHGWDDAAIPAGNSLRYHAAVRRAVGRSAEDNMRLFMLPGVAHCAGGHGPDTVDYLSALDQWVESGVAPDRMVATKYDSLIKVMTGQPANVVRSRPACAWPKRVRYSGNGSVDEAASYVCR